MRSGCFNTHIASKLRRQDSVFWSQENTRYRSIYNFVIKYSQNIRTNLQNPSHIRCECPFFHPFQMLQNRGFALNLRLLLLYHILFQIASVFFKNPCLIRGYDRGFMLFVRSVRVCSLVTASEKSLQRPHGRYGNLSHCISPHFLLLVFIRLPADRCCDRDICHGFSPAFRWVHSIRN